MLHKEPDTIGYEGTERRHARAPLSDMARLWSLPPDEPGEIASLLTILVGQLALGFGARAVLIAEADGSASLRPVVAWPPSEGPWGGALLAATVSIKEVLAGHAVAIVSGAHRRLPEDSPFRELPIEALAVVPIICDAGSSIGAVALIHDEPIQHADEVLLNIANAARHAATLIEGRRAHERLKSSEARFRDLYENAPLAYFTVDTAGVVQGANRRARGLLASNGLSVIGKHVLDLYADSPSGRGKAQALFQRFKAGLAIDGEELEMQRLSGESVWVNLTVEPIKDETGVVVASRSAVVDVTQRHALEEELRARARLDTLTGALNHAAMVEELEHRTASSAGEFTVCMVDLDSFKTINDSFGHLTGDEVLKEVARVLGGAGVVVGRFGGDEFLLLVEGSPAQARFFVRGVGERMMQIRVGQRPMPVRASFGSAGYPDAAKSAMELIRLADADMYRSRQVARRARRTRAV